MIAVSRRTVLGQGLLPEPFRPSFEQLMNGSLDGQWVEVEGGVLEQQVEPTGTVLLVGMIGGQIPAFIPAQNQDPASVDSFALMIPAPENIVVLSKPPWWNLRHTLTIVGALGVVVILAIGWITVLRRQVEERTTQLAAEIQERQRVEQQQALERERTRVAQDLHDELGSGLTEVGILGALVKNPEIPPAQKAGYLDQVIRVSRGLVTALDEIVWAVNPRYDSVTALGAYCALYAQRFLELSAIRCFLDMAANLPEHPLDSRTCHGLFLAFKEALNNGVRHFQATEARLRLRVDSGELRFEITDNGRGLEGRLPAPGMDGLTGMQERLRGLGGTCRIESQAGQGTTVEFCLPLNAVAAHGAAPTADGSRTTQKGSLLRRLARLAFIRVHKPVFDEQHSGNR